MVGLVMALSGSRIAISPKVFIGCQAILGCMTSRRSLTFHFGGAGQV
ncbi:hypothetical protein SGGMMB4_05520 [Sodalis glossinidius str. 'morsitans']|uniref:Uncharacterized protein n=1 Tax=Sodalis glossinidius (strain morsitans) TaxID=343509 RepID=A0A193QP36_SODGM|nr:hypothetical protein SGGMMB4_05520 [Sodalis glossinidius str. 'morsitans']